MSTAVQPVARLQGCLELLFKDSFVAQYPETISCFPHKKKILMGLILNPSFKGDKTAEAQSRKDSFPLSTRWRNSSSSCLMVSHLTSSSLLLRLTQALPSSTSLHLFSAFS